MQILNKVKTVRDEVLKRCGDEPIQLDTVSQVFKDITIIDEVYFVEFDAGASNPFLGRFKRWDQPDGVYAQIKTIVEVSYSTHLDEPWRRFVVCKELCHALEAEKGDSSITDNDVSELIEAFSVSSASGNVGDILKTSPTEVLSEFAAIEILIPLPVRRKFLRDGGTAVHGLSRFSREYNVPERFVRLSLLPDYMQYVADVLDGDV